MKPDFHGLPLLKRYKLRQQVVEDDLHQHTPPPASPSPCRLPAKKRKASRESSLSPPLHTPSLPAKKRIWALQQPLFQSPEKPNFLFDLNLEYQQSPDKNSPKSPKPKAVTPQRLNLGEIQRTPEKKSPESPTPKLVSPQKLNLDDPKPSPKKKSLESPIPKFISPKKSNLDETQQSPEKKTPKSPTFKLISPRKLNLDEEDNDGILCAICQSTDGDPSDPIVFCDGCDLMVHSSCYGEPLISGIPEGDWFCTNCQHNGSLASAASCCLCPIKGGAMKQTTDGKWAHILCALFVPEVFFRHPEGREGIDCTKVPRRRWEEKCYVCESGKGCVIECSEPKCLLGFHVTCGLKEELCIEYKQGRGGDIVAGFCKRHSEIWKKQQQSGKFKIVAREELKK